MVWIKRFPVSTKTLNICWTVRRCQYSNIVEKQIPKNTSSSGGNESGSKNSDIIRPISMAYTEYTSPEEVQNIPPLIIMHGLMGSRNNWKSIAKAFHVRTKLKVLAVDARNHGDSTHSDEMSYAHLAEDLRKFMEVKQLKQAAFLGHSMGGRAVMTLALKHPDLVSRLVVVDISPIAASPSLHLMPRFFDAMTAVTLPPNISPSDARASADKQLRPVVEDRGVRQFLLTNLVQGIDGKYKWRLNLDGIARGFGQISTFPVADMSPVYPGPTLFVSGAKSDYVPLDSHAATRKLFPAARFVAINDAGHWVHAEKPNEFLDSVVPFLVPTSPDAR